MKRCIVCGKEITKNKIVCEDCLRFFVWKHKGNFAERIIHFKEFEKERFDFRSTKCRRLKK